MKSLQLTKPYMLVVVGLPGSGKTFFAKQFSDTFNTPYINYGYYAHAISDKKTRSVMIEHIYSMLLKTRAAVVVEGHGSTANERRELTEMAAKNGYRTLFVWVQTEPATAEHRAVYAKSATMKQDAFDKAMKNFENLSAREPYMVISGKHTFSSQAKTVLKRLVSERPAAPNPTPPAPRSDARPEPRPDTPGRVNVK